MQAWCRGLLAVNFESITLTNLHCWMARWCFLKLAKCFTFNTFGEWWSRSWICGLCHDSGDISVQEEMNSTITGSRGCNSKPELIKWGLLSCECRRSKRCTSRTRTNRISYSAYIWPAQSRGPPLKGRYVHGRGVHEFHRSGLNVVTSGPKISFRRCRRKGE